MKKFSKIFMFSCFFCATLLAFQNCSNGFSSSQIGEGSLSSEADDSTGASTPPPTSDPITPLPNPPANGEVRHGDLIQISGSGFGSNAPVYGFAGGDDGELETTALGAIPSFGHNVEGPSRDRGHFNWTRFATASTVINDPSRGKVLGFKRPTGDDETSQEYYLPSDIPTGGRLYVSYWVRVGLSVVNGSVGPQMKFIRINAGTSAIEDTNHNLYFNYHHSNGGMMLFANSAGGSPLSDTFYLGGGSGRVAPNGQWGRVELKIITGTQGQNNCQVYIRNIQGATVPGFISAKAAGTEHSLQSEIGCYPDANRYSSVLFQNWYGNGFTNADLAWDDHYVQQGTFKRVELWNSLDPAQATVREIQKSITWSDGMVTTRLNRGGVTAGKYYLVVLGDSVNDVVLGYKEVLVK